MNLLFSSLETDEPRKKESLFIKENGRKIKKYIVASVPVVAAH